MVSCGKIGGHSRAGFPHVVWNHEESAEPMRLESWPLVDLGSAWEELDLVRNYIKQLIMLSVPE
jgi:hypothetical protein